jgi:hypothetical protein
MQVWLDGKPLPLQTPEETDHKFDAKPCYRSHAIVQPGSHVVEYRPNATVDDFFPISHMIWY